ncbi:hypothetical protein IG631_22512 [Alternaria alternata]|nr:hypothetical protein IG631_22512 [Alternaria alternata]
MQDPLKEADGNDSTLESGTGSDFETVNEDNQGRAKSQWSCDAVSSVKFLLVWPQPRRLCWFLREATYLGQET